MFCIIMYSACIVMGVFNIFLAAKLRDNPRYVIIMNAVVGGWCIGIGWMGLIR